MMQYKNSKDTGQYPHHDKRQTPRSNKQQATPRDTLIDGLVLKGVW